MTDSDASASPIGNMLGRRVLAVDKAQQSTRMAFTIGEQFLNRQGVIHGGILATMLDSLCGFTLWATTKRFGNTLELKTCFLQRCQPGAYQGVGQAVRIGRSIAFLEAALYNADEELVATASATFKLRSENAKVPKLKNT